MRTVAITSEFITTGQFLKFVGIIAFGGEAKGFLQNHQVKVNGEDDNRRGRKLRPGDIIAIDGVEYRIGGDDSQEA